MRLAGLLLALLFHGGSPVELSPVDNQGCETDADCGLGNWCDMTAQFCPLGQPGTPDPNVTGLLPPPVWVANNTDTGERFRSEESPPQNVVVAAVAYPFKAAAGLFMPAPQRRQSDGDLSPMTASSRPVSRAHRANTSTTTMNSPPPAPRMLDDHELPRPPIARNDRGLGSTWSGES